MANLWKSKKITINLLTVKSHVIFLYSGVERRLLSCSEKQNFLKDCIPLMKHEEVTVFRPLGGEGELNRDSEVLLSESEILKSFLGQLIFRQVL